MPSLRNRLLALLGAVLLAACQAAEMPAPPAARQMSIAQARAFTGTEPVAVIGIVTVPSGAFASSLSTGFAIQDGTAGIYVLDTEHKFGLGDRVRVTGVRGEEFKQRIIRLQSAQRQRGFATVIPRSVATGRFGEAEEGLLIQTAGRITRIQDDAPHGYKIFIDDGSGELQVFIDASTPLIETATDWKPGERIRVIGFAGRYEDTREIMPRIGSDIRR